MASLTERDDGRWLVRWRDPEGREHVKTFRRKTDARTLVDQLTAAKVRNDYLDPARGRVHFGAWGEQYLASRVNLKPKTEAGYESLWKTQIKPRWEHVPLVRVSHSDVAGWVSEMAANLSASRTRQAFHLFGAMLDAAVRDRRIAANPAAGTDLPRLPKHERRYLDHGDVARLAKACGDYESMILVAAYCGLRWGELTALRVRNVDTVHRRIRVVEAVSEVDGRMIFGSPKSHAARTVPMPKTVAQRVRRHVAGRGPGELVWTSRRGAVLRNQNFRRNVFNEAATSAGLEGVTPHELRHAAASMMIASGASVKAVQLALGHASASMTLDTYAGLWPDELDAVAGRLDRALADFSRTPAVHAVGVTP